MAGIGLYGVYYSKGVIENGVLTGYTGVQQMGKAISAAFTPVDQNSNPLYANNGIAERDAAAGSGGELSITLDRVIRAAMADLYGLTEKAVTIGGAGGSGFDFDGTELSAPVGVGFVRWNQENNSRSHYQAVIFSYVVFGPMTENSQTLGETVEWQTPELTGTVSGGAVCGAKPWKKLYDFETQEAAIAFITDYFQASAVTT